MIAKGCPRCRSVANVNPSRQAEYAKGGGKRCDWCGYSFHESELVPVEVPGPEPEPKKKREKIPPTTPLFED